MKIEFNNQMESLRLWKKSPPPTLSCCVRCPGVTSSTRGSAVRQFPTERLTVALKYICQWSAIKTRTEPSPKRYSPIIVSPPPHRNNNEKQLIVTIKASLLLRKRLANKLRMRIGDIGYGEGSRQWSCGALCALIKALLKPQVRASLVRTTHTRT